MEGLQWLKSSTFKNYRDQEFHLPFPFSNIDENVFPLYIKPWERDMPLFSLHLTMSTHEIRMHSK